MILKVRCVACRKKGKVLILFGRILSRKWWFFGTYKMKKEFRCIKHDRERYHVIEYWECQKCREND